MMRRHLSCILSGLVLVGWIVTVGASEARAEVEASSSKYRSFDVPEVFSPRQLILTSNYQGKTLLAGTVAPPKEEGAEERPPPECMVIIVSGSGDETSAQAWPYRHSPKGTACIGALPHPEGGFFLRGFRADAGEGDVAGMMARIGPEGNEQWLTTDTEIDASSSFKGTYQHPNAVLAYSESSGYLLGMTIGKFSFGNLDQKDVTYASIYQTDDGRLRTKAQTIGDRSGFGKTGGAFALESSGRFLIYNVSQAGEGVNFYTYNGRLSISAFEPLGENWSDRNVVDVVHGPDQNIYILWTTQSSSTTQTRLAVVDEQAEEVWTQAWRASVTVGEGEGEQELVLETPKSVMVGEKYTVIRYTKERKRYLRVVDTESGGLYGVVRLQPLVKGGQYVSLLKGQDGRLKTLGVGSKGRTFTEAELTFEGTIESDPDGEPQDAGGAPTDDDPSEDAGMADATVGADVAPSEAAGSSSSDDDGDGGGCHTLGSSRPPGDWLVLFGLIGLAWRQRRRGIAKDDSSTVHM